VKNIYLHFLEISEKQKKLALATIIKTMGSTPQVPGSSAIFSNEGLIAGTLGGGIMELDAENQSKAALKNGRPVIMDYRLEANIDAEKGAICGGRASLLIDPHPEWSLQEFKKMQKALENQISGAFMTIGKMDQNNTLNLERNWVQENYEKSKLPIHLHPFFTTVNQSIREGIPVMINSFDAYSGIEYQPDFIFIEPIRPLDRLYIIGGGHIGRALAHLSNLLGFSTTVIDNRQGIENEADLSKTAQVIVGDIEKNLSGLPIDELTCIVIATQGHQYDAEALKACIHSQACYIGLMGSKRKIRLMREKFIDEGWATAKEFDAIHAPIGLDIHSETVPEIAISIAAELIKVQKEQRDKLKIPKVCCMILAAGESRRMKQQKLLMDYHGKSFIKTIVNKVKSSEADQTLVILGSDSEKIADQIKPYHVDTVFNPHYKEGMLSSIQCGLNSLSKSIDAVLVVLGDQPMIEVDVINELINKYRKTRAKIIIPVYQGKRGHPVLIETMYRDEVFTLNPDKGLRELIYSHHEDIYELEVNTPSILKDIDTIEDYKNEIA